MYKGVEKKALAALLCVGMAAGAIEVVPRVMAAVSAQGGGCTR